MTKMLECVVCQHPAIPSNCRLEHDARVAGWLDGTRVRCPKCGVRLRVDVPDDYSEDRAAFVRVDDTLEKIAARLRNHKGINAAVCMLQEMRDVYQPATVTPLVLPPWQENEKQTHELLETLLELLDAAQDTGVPQELQLGDLVILHGTGCEPHKVEVKRLSHHGVWYHCRSTVFGNVIETYVEGVIRMATAEDRRAAMQVAAIKDHQ